MGLYDNPNFTQQNPNLTSCKICGKEISKNAKMCPHCGAKNTKPFYQTWWFWTILIILVIGLANSHDETVPTSNNNRAYSVSKRNPVVVADLSSMTEAERDSWCNSNNINCITKTEYSNTVPKDGFIRQSVEPGKTIYEGDNITISFSLGKQPSIGQRNALRKAETYSSMMHMSKKGIYRQLTSEYGEGFTAEEAQYAIDNIKADWNENALAKAKNYQNLMSMSKSAIYNQLVSEYGEAFTAKEAQYAIDHLDD